MEKFVALFLVIAVVIGLVLHRQRQTQRDQKPQVSPQVAHSEIAVPTPAAETVTAVPSRGQIRLRMATNDGSLRELVVDQTPYTIGRKRGDNDLALEASSFGPGTDTVSRRHAKLVYHPDEERWHIEDVGSTNGSFVNQRRIGREMLRNGDQILIGGVVLTFVTERVSRETPAVRLTQGRFTDIVRLSPGGTADVYRAVDTREGRTVAVKVPRLGRNDDPDALQRFRDEVSWAVQLHHPNIVRVYGGDRLPDGAICMIMEYLPGGSLRQHMTPGKALPEEKVRLIGSQIGQGLTYVHNCRLVHRDIKPENILFAADGNLRITDFGIAHNANDARMVVGMQIGTPHYMCPEQIRCEMPTPAFDLYAFGCVLYEMSVGRCPFEGAYEQVIAGHLTQVPESPARINSQVSPALDRLIMQLLDKNPYQRPGTAADVIAALSGAVPA